MMTRYLLLFKQRRRYATHILYAKVPVASTQISPFPMPMPMPMPIPSCHPLPPKVSVSSSFRSCFLALLFFFPFNPPRGFFKHWQITQKKNSTKVFPSLTSITTSPPTPPPPTPTRFLLSSTLPSFSSLSPHLLPSTIIPSSVSLPRPRRLFILPLRGPWWCFHRLLPCSTTTTMVS